MTSPNKPGYVFEGPAMELIDNDGCFENNCLMIHVSKDKSEVMVLIMVENIVSLGATSGTKAPTKCGICTI